MIKEKFTACWKGVDRNVTVYYIVDKEWNQPEYLGIFMDGEEQEITDELIWACDAWLKEFV